MSDEVLRIVPTDPNWQPDDETAVAVTALIRALTLVDGDGGWTDTRFADQPELIDCGENFQGIRCPACGADLGMDWFDGEVNRTHPHAPLDRTVPCCGVRTTLNDLLFDWPMAFARFAVDVWNPSRLVPEADGLLDERSLAAVASRLGHSVRQVRARY